MLIVQASAAVIAARCLSLKQSRGGLRRCSTVGKCTISGRPVTGVSTGGWHGGGVRYPLSEPCPNRPFLRPAITRLQVGLQGKHLVDPAQFDDRTWVAATWTFDGVTVSALGHNEYHADQFPGHCQFKTYRECQYNAIVPLSSWDGGRSFAQTRYPAPIAAPPMKSDVDQGRPRGYVNPSNIVFHDGYYYTLIGRSDFGKKRQAGVCFIPRMCLPRRPGRYGTASRTSRSLVARSEGAWTEKSTCEAATGLGGALGSISPKIKILGSLRAFWMPSRQTV